MPPSHETTTISIFRNLPLWKPVPDLKSHLTKKSAISCVLKNAFYPLGQSGRHVRILVDPCSRPVQGHPFVIAPFWRWEKWPTVVSESETNQSFFGWSVAFDRIPTTEPILYKKWFGNIEKNPFPKVLKGSVRYFLKELPKDFEWVSFFPENSVHSHHSHKIFTLVDNLLSFFLVLIEPWAIFLLYWAFVASTHTQVSQNFGQLFYFFFFPKENILQSFLQAVMNCQKWECVRLLPNATLFIGVWDSGALASFLIKRQTVGRAPKPGRPFASWTTMCRISGDV